MDDWMFPVPERGDRVKKSIRFAMSAFGERDKVQETTIPSKQSTARSQRTAPSMVNWVTSVTHSMFGASAWKSAPTRFAGASPTPAWELHRFSTSGTQAAWPPRCDPHDDLLRDDDRVGLVRRSMRWMVRIPMRAHPLLEQAGGASPPAGVPVARGDRRARNSRCCVSFSAGAST